MESPAQNSRLVRFGPFEADLRTRELRKHGIRIRLQEQPFQILAMLLERPDELVTREEIQQKLWPEDTFVDFDHGLNAAIRRLRDALNDSADTPRFIETLPRRGYRFLAPVEGLTPPSVPASPSNEVAVPAAAAPELAQIPAIKAVSHRRVWIGSAIVLAAALAGLLAWREWPSRDTTIDSIAILPFLNESKEPGLDYLSDGIAETILDNLARIPSLKVASRNSAFVYRGRGVDAKTLARELNVRAVLLGSVRALAASSTANPDFSDVRLEVELVDTQNDRRLWGERYTIKRLQVNEIQSEISDRVTEKLALHLSPALRQRVTRHQTENNAAFDAYLHGKFLLDTRGGNSVFREGLGYFREALALDPNYALAYTGVSAAYGLLAFYGGMWPVEAYREEQAAIARALQLDPELADAHVQQGYLLQGFHRDMAAAEREFLRAIELQPNSGSAHHALALHLSLMGRADESIAEARRAAELEPSLPPSRGTLLWIEYFAHRFADMAELLQTMPTQQPSHCYTAAQQEASGHYPQALVEIEQSNWAPGMFCSLPHVYAVAGRQADARRILNQLIEKRRSEYVSAYQIALIYAGLGNSEEMLHWLEVADQELDSWVLWLKQDPRFDSYRSQPKFASIQQHAFTPR